MTSPDVRNLKILHVLRAPLGGLFRHVLDLAREQSTRGHSVGLIADSTTGGAWADAVLRELEPCLKLGLTRTWMRRNPHVLDAAALTHVIGRIRRATPDIVHGHGSKGGAFARLPAFLPGIKAKCAYTPHGGSFNYQPGSVLHAFYMSAERLLARRTNAFLFESAFIQGCFHKYVSAETALERVVLNGISAAEFVPVKAAPDAADFVYVGELRAAKGIDTMLEALVAVGRRTGRPPRAVLVGSGPDRERLAHQASELGLADAVSFTGQLPARQAFSLGRIMVVPSRAESLPYVVLEAAGARIPLIATNVGGIPEIFGPFRERLIPCNDVERLAGAMLDSLSASDEKRLVESEELAQYVASNFTIAKMVDSVIAAYCEALDRPFQNRQTEIIPITTSS